MLKAIIPNGINRSILHTRREIVYLNPKTVILMLNYLRLGFRTDTAYYAAQIIQTRPLVILTFIDNKPSFHELSNIFPSIRFIAIQNGNRFPYPYACLPPEGRYRSEILLWSIFEKNNYSSFGTTFKNVHVTGSLRNQICWGKVEHAASRDQLQFDVCLISTFSSSVKDLLWVRESQLLCLWLNDFLRSNPSVKACVALCNGSDGGIDLTQEVEFFQDALGDQVALIPKDTQFSSYLASDASSVTISVGSSVSLEALARGNRSMIVHPIRTSESSMGAECGINLYATNPEEFTGKLTELLNLSDLEFGSVYEDEISYLSHPISISGVSETLDEILWNTLSTLDSKCS